MFFQHRLCNLPHPAHNGVHFCGRAENEND